MEQEHQRAAGAWQAEWGTITDLLRLTGVGPEADLGAAPILVDRALEVHER
jgi:hypothetical protein